MIEVRILESKPVAEVKLAGVVTQDNIKNMEDRILPALEQTNKLGFVIDVRDWDDITEDAIREDLRFEMKMLRRLVDIGNVAIISDKQWVAAVTKMLSPWFPGSALQAFTGEQKDEARAFAAEMDS